MFEPHKFAKVLPAMSGEDYGRFRADVAEKGLLEPITLYEGKVLDGINRQKACDETGVSPRYEEFTGDDPLGFVFSRNLARRHLEPGQAGMVAAELLDRYGRKGAGQPKKYSPDSENTFLTVSEAAKAVGVSESTVGAARRVKKERPDLGRKVKAGKMTLNAAYEETTGKHTGGNGPRRTKAWNGKTNPTREREIHAARKNGKNGAGKDNYNDLLKLSLAMSRECSIIESYLPLLEDFDIDQTSLDLIDSFHDDLITLAQWSDRALMVTQGWLGDVKVRRKIEALRNTAGRTPEETENFIRLAKKLERKLEAVLPSGV